ncbi:MAG: amidohydrolase family protein, partial [Acidobacteria bacterium]|nr:amidohydrolase family protein [Acidobacteriota bacterium]
LVAHQRAMGVSLTVLLPTDPVTGLAVKAGGNDTVAALSARLPREYVWFCNEHPDTPGAIKILEKWLDKGAIGLGEQKLEIACDSPWIHSLAALAAERRIPLLMHFQHGTYNTGYERFSRMLAKYPKTQFIGHAQTFWGHVDAALKPDDLYPKGPVQPGGLTDRLLADYENFHGDLSAGSGLNAFTRDEEHGRAFLLRHHRKLLFGTDCDDRVAFTERCTGSRQLALIRKLVTDPVARRNILSANARRLMKLPS